MPASADAAPFGLQRLRQGSATGQENYLYTDGGVVFAQASVDAAAYQRFSVVDPTGTVRASTACTQSLVKGTKTFQYAIKPTDPTTGATAWRFRVDQWTNFSCSGTPAKTGSKYFDIARASSFADAALATPRSVFSAGSSAYVKASGIGVVKLSAANTAQADWQTTWLRPSGATACANTANADRPDATAGAVLASGSYLKYRPNTVAGGAAWNLESNYETRPCQAFSSANEGTWSVRLQKDATHFVTLKAFTVDATPPETTITARPTGSTPFTSADLGFVATQPDATFECQLDGGAWAACTSPAHYPGLSEASHTFQVRALDPAGNVDATPASTTWTVDTTLPAVTLTDPADGVATNDSTPDIGGLAGNAPGDSATVTVKIMEPVAGGPDQLVQTLTATRSGATWSVAPTVPLPDGTYRVHAEQADAAASLAFTAEHSFRVDTAAPDVAVLEPRTGSVTSDPAAHLWGTGGLAAGDDSHVTVKLWAGSSASGAPAQTATATVDTAGNWTLDASPALADGTYTARAEQADDAGNLALSHVHTFDVDATAPDTTITLAPSAATGSTAASFRFTADEASATFECLIDDIDWAPCDSPKSYSGLAAGPHTFTVRAIDAAGNEDGSPASTTWTIDTTLPDVTVVNPADGSTTNAAAPVFDGSASTAAGDSTTVTVKLYQPVAGGPDQLVEMHTATRAGDGSWATAADPGLAEGDYVVRAEQQDGVGNTGTSAPHSFRVDRTAPDTLFTQTPPAVTGTTSADFRFDSTDTAAGYECRLDGGAWAACSSPDVQSGLGAGSHTFEARATDEAGNTDATPAAATWTVNPALPGLTLGAPADGTRTNDPTPSFSGVGGTAAGDSATVTLKVYRPVAGAPDVLEQSLPTTRSPADGSWSVTVSDLPDGRYVAYAEQDGTVGTAVTAATSFTIDTTPPHTTISSGPQGTTASSSAGFGFTAGESGATFECRLDGGAWAPCSSPQSYSSLTDDVHTFDVRAADDVGNVDPTPASRTWTVDSSGAVVTLESPADDALTNDATTGFNGHASTAAGDSATVNVEIYRPVAGGADDLVQTLSATRAAIGGYWSVSASPALADGTYIAYANQDDSTAQTSYSAPRRFTVDTTEPGVTLTSPAVGQPTNDTTPTLGGAAGNATGDSTTVTVNVYAGSGVSGSPIQTLSPTRTGGSWSAVPSALADGTYTAQAVQTDAAGNTGTSVARSFTIDATAPDTAIDSGPAANTTATDADFGFSSAEPGAGFECSLDGGAWTPCTSPQSYTGLAVGDHDFAVRALDSVGNADGSPATQSWTIDAPAGGGGGGTGGGTGGDTGGGTGGDTGGGTDGGTGGDTGGGTGGGDTGGGTGGIVIPSSSALELRLTGKKKQRVGGKKPRLTLSAICSADCSMKLSGTIVLSRARAAGVSKRQARPKKLKLRAKTYALAGTKTTRVVITIPRRLARQILAGLKQRRTAKLTMTGAASSAGGAAPSRVLKISLKR